MLKNKKDTIKSLEKLFLIKKDDENEEQENQEKESSVSDEIELKNQEPDIAVTYPFALNRAYTQAIATRTFAKLYGRDKLMGYDYTDETVPLDVTDLGIGNPFTINTVDESEIDMLSKKFIKKFMHLIDRYDVKDLFPTAGRKYNINEDNVYVDIYSNGVYINVNHSHAFINYEDENEKNEKNVRLNEGLLSSDNVKVEKYDEKHYKIIGLYDKQFEADIENNIENGWRLLDMFDIVTQNKFIFMKDEYVIIHQFFIPEVLNICVLLYKATGKKKYKNAIKALTKDTWLSEKPKYITRIDSSKLKDLKYTLKPYQHHFIFEEYPKLKNEFKLNGGLLAFDQGLGKTFTSLALMHLLNKKLTIAICPKTLMISGWKEEIQSIFNFEVSDDEIYVIGIDKKSKLSLQGSRIKYIIVNYERILEALDAASYVMKKRQLKGIDIGVIVDECQNFRHINTKRVKNLIKLVRTLNTFDNLLLSGTPIKSTYAELAPYLYVIDPKFDDEALKTFLEIFKVNEAVASEIIKARFQSISYRVTKQQVLKLPPREFYDLDVTIPHIEKYYLSTIRNEINKKFEVMLKAEMKKFPTYMKRFNEILDRALEMCILDNDEKCEHLIETYKKVVNKSRRGLLIEIMEKDDRDKFLQLERQVESYIKSKDKKLYREFRTLKKKVRSLALSVLGIAVGTTLAEKRKEMILDIFTYNIKLVCTLINQSQKTIIFTYSKAAADELGEIIKAKCGYKTLTITGDTKNRQNVISEFKKDPDVRVLIATYQVASVGLTLTEANVMIYADKPYRKEDLDQAHDRIYRIGQQNKVYVFYLKLKSKEPTIQDRIDEIIDYYSKIVGKVITETPAVHNELNL